MEVAEMPGLFDPIKIKDLPSKSYRDAADGHRDGG